MQRQNSVRKVFMLLIILAALLTLIVSNGLLCSFQYNADIEAIGNLHSLHIPNNNDNNLGPDPQTSPSSTERKDAMMSLNELTRARAEDLIECPKNLILLSNVAAATAGQGGPGVGTERKIPRIIHQTVKSRCVTRDVADAVKVWQGGFDATHSYYIHDDAAVMRLLLQQKEHFPEFPHLSLIADRCLVHGTLKADLWRYLILYLYGGIYADIDAVPAKFHGETSIPASYDSYFVIEQYHLLSQWFIAVSPKHPLMFYAVQKCLQNLLAAPDTGSVPGMSNIVGISVSTCYSLLNLSLM
jgi:mannosyltransferase OCH1-like enzyme